MNIEKELAEQSIRLDAQLIRINKHIESFKSRRDKPTGILHMPLGELVRGFIRRISK